MYGFEAITANNGWSMAIIGALIDLSGLAVLATIISQLHKLLEFLENRKKTADDSAPPLKKSGGKGISIPEMFPEDILEVAKLYDPLIKKIGSEFQLTELYRLANENKYPHPHLTITSFREQGILTPKGDGIFIWNQ